MNTTMKMKALIAGAASAMLLAGAMIGCSGADPAPEAGNAGSGTLVSEFPLHADNMADGGAGLASFHAGAGLSCADCHTGDLKAEVAALKDDGTEEPALSSSYYMDSETCLSCHGGSWEALAKTTSDLGDYNPHDSIHGTIENCNECHKGHSGQVDLCSECHDNGGQAMKGAM